MLTAFPPHFTVLRGQSYISASHTSSENLRSRSIHQGMFSFKKACLECLQFLISVP